MLNGPRMRAGMMCPNELKIVMRGAYVSKAQRSMSILLLISVLGMSARTDAKVATGTLEGIVLDAQGKPVDYATVTIQTSDGNHPNLTRTDSEGHFEFARFETGQYDLRAESGGLFSPWTRRISIHAHKMAQVTLRLASSKP